MSSKDLKLILNYDGRFDPAEVPYNKNLLHLAVGAIQPDRLFALRYQALPCTMSLAPPRQQSSYVYQPNARVGHLTSTLNHLINKYGLDQNRFISNTQYDLETKSVYHTELFIDLGDYVSVYLSGGHLSTKEMENPSNLIPDTEDKRFICFSSTLVYYIPQSIERAKAIFDETSQFYLLQPVETCLLMVCHNTNSGFYMSNINIKKPVIRDLKTSYGEKFTEINEKLLTELRKPNSSGITFLHGEPGTGKTYYIRHLINEITEKNLIYVPPDLVNEITKPGFLPFLMQYPDSILIIEDAENIIIDRKESSNPNQAVSNLLNLSDGLLGDAMRLQIITTFNCEMKAIDPALLREGRLIVEHKFEKLPTENVKRLFKDLNIEGAEEIDQPMTLAEIYAKKTSGVAK